MKDFIEQQILQAVRELLTGKVNEILGELAFSIPLIEFGNYRSGKVIVPVITLNTCEMTEKERIIRLDCYSMNITFTFPDTQDAELHCYTYSDAVRKALEQDKTLGGVVDRAIITGKKYMPPRNPECNEGFGVIMILRLTLIVG